MYSLYHKFNKTIFDIEADMLISLGHPPTTNVLGVRVPGPIRPFVSEGRTLRRDYDLQQDPGPADR
jgi:hypothetical protein